MVSRTDMSSRRVSISCELSSCWRLSDWAMCAISACWEARVALKRDAEELSPTVTTTTSLPLSQLQIWHSPQRTSRAAMPIRM